MRFGGIPIRNHQNLKDLHIYTTFKYSFNDSSQKHKFKNFNILLLISCHCSSSSSPSTFTSPSSVNHHHHDTLLNLSLPPSSSPTPSYSTFNIKSPKLLILNPNFLPFQIRNIIFYFSLKLLGG